MWCMEACLNYYMFKCSMWCIWIFMICVKYIICLPFFSPFSLISKDSHITHSSCLLWDAVYYLQLFLFKPLIWPLSVPLQFPDSKLIIPVNTKVIPLRGTSLSFRVTNHAFLWHSILLRYIPFRPFNTWLNCNLQKY